ncbi:rop guanine nucleotide exchange factor 1-like isoform X2 [Mercurialis annua]|uniref:rop guanine nucleotide exchange factor 1-like isoform X2 n=1 Tax=Mercurialis annua TaxID=3986 RepID=UPI00215ED129|nr:rop guanine nucleotide exchange factor 1-like isoform X2 [Mercurialis annua]
MAFVQLLPSPMPLQIYLRSKRIAKISRFCLCTSAHIKVYLAASVFGELWKLEPLSPQKKSMWNREMELLLCVSDSIVELVPSKQDFPGSGTFEVMVPRPRLDLFVNLPALKKLDAMLLDILDGFSGSEFYYVDRGVIVAGGDETQTFTLPSSSARLSISNEKCWLPFPKVPQNGLSGDTRKSLQQCKECTNQIFKAAMAINSSVLTEMEVPNAYLESLPKSGKACLGEDIYRHVATKRFSPDSLLDYLDLSSEYSTLDVSNRIEAAAHIWRKKYLKGHSIHERAGKKSTWGGRVKGLVGELERSKLLARRAEILLDSLRLRFPALPQTTLDTNKIQCNKDVGHAIIESYSRVIESLAFNMISRINDLLYVDDATKQRAAAELASWYDQGRLGVGAHPEQNQMSLGPVSFRHSFSASSTPLQAFDSSREKTRFSHGSADHFTKKGKIRNSPIQTLQKLTF